MPNDAGGFLYHYCIVQCFAWVDAEYEDRVMPGDDAAAVRLPRAALLLAKLNVAGQDLKSAQAQLEWAAANSKEPAVKDLAHLRLAGVQLDQKQYDAALKTLSGTHSDAFAFRFHDLKGDVLLAQGKQADARAAYQAAFSKMQEDNPYRTIVELKATGVAILLVEQNARAALQIADYGYVLETGEVSLAAPSGELAADSRVIESYLGLGHRQH